jgi:hypothetical protein
MEKTTPEEVVLKLVEMVNGNVSREHASDYLDPLVTIHMDSAIYKGIEMWQKWIYLIRNSGRVRELRMIPCEVSCDAQDPCIVNLAIRWIGIRQCDNSLCETSETYHLRYRVEHNLIVEIWTRKINYVFIFGSWIRFAVFLRLFFGWAVLYFITLRLLDGDYRIDRVVKL